MTAESIWILMLAWITASVTLLWLDARRLAAFYRRCYHEANRGWKDALDGWQRSNQISIDQTDTIRAITEEFFEETGRVPDRIEAEMVISDSTMQN